MIKTATPLKNKFSESIFTNNLLEANKNGIGNTNLLRTILASASNKNIKMINNINFKQNPEDVLDIAENKMIPNFMNQNDYKEILNNFGKIKIILI